MRFFLQEHHINFILVPCSDSRTLYSTISMQQIVLIPVLYIHYINAANGIASKDIKTSIAAQFVLK